MKLHPIHIAKATLSALIERALEGELVVIARGKKPMVRLVPVEGARTTREFGVMKGRAKVTDAFFEELPPDELESWQQ